MARTIARCIVTVLFVCGAPSATDAQWRVTSCTTTGKNLFVRDVLTDIYYWYNELPGLNPVSYPSPEEYLEAVRFRPLDDHFSYITSREANEAFYGESQYVGFGMSTSVVGQ